MKKIFKKTQFSKKLKKFIFILFCMKTPVQEFFPERSHLTPVKQIRYVPCILICKSLKTSIWANLGHLARKCRKNISRKHSIK